jgi:hypothetical protein
MRTLRTLVAALACTAMLSVVGVSAAGAQASGRCAKIAQITARIEAKKAKAEERRARFEAQLQERPRAAEWVQRHQARMDSALARIEARATKALQGCST